MSVTIDNNLFTTLTAQPFGYEETDTRAGLTAQRVRLNGLLTPEEWADLLYSYDEWRNIRITEPDSLKADDIGTTVAVSFSANGISWSNVACWFASAPQAEQVGVYLSVSCEMVDALEALEVAKRKKEKDEDANRPDLGTFTLGSAVIKLLNPPETFQDVPQLTMTTTGNHLIQGVPNITTAYQIEGTTDATGWDDLLTWVETTAATRPAAGDLFPLGAPTATAKNTVVDGLTIVEYTVSIAVAEVQ